MSIFEYDKEKEEKKLRKAEYEAGRQEGRQEGLMQGIVRMGKEFGLSDVALIKQLQDKLDIDEAEAEEYLRVK